MLNLTPHKPDFKTDQPAPPGPGEIPDGFDPASMPIISRHWLGIEPFPSVGAEAAALIADLKYRAKVKCLLALGDRPIAEMIAELVTAHGLETAVDQLLDKYLSISDEALDLVNGRDFSPLPLHEIKS